MFCASCGAQNPDDAQVCAVCGTPLVDGAPAPAPAPAPEPVAAPETGAVGEKRGKMGMDPQKRSTVIGIAAIAAVALVVIIAVVAIITGKPAYVKTVEKYCGALVKADAKALVSVIPPEVAKELEENFDDRKEMLEIMKDNLEDARDDLEDEYGSKLKVKCEVRRDKKLGAKEVKNLEESYENRYDIDMKIKEARELRVRVTISGKEDKESETMELIALKIGGKWYLDTRGLYTYTSY